MAVLYPLGLPQSPQRTGYSNTQKNNVIRSTVDVGEAKMRRRYTKPIINESWALTLSATQLPIFLNWFENDIESGVLRFDFKDPLTGLTATYRITDMYSLTPFGTCGSFMARFPVEKLP